MTSIIRYHSYVEPNFKKDTNELIDKTETDIQILKTNLEMLEGGINQELGMNMYTLLYMIDKQQGPNVQHRELYLIFCDNLYEKRI